MKDSWKQQFLEEKPGKNKKGEYIGSIIWNLIAIFIVNKLPSWGACFINDQYMVVLYMLNICIIAQIVGNLFMLLLDIRLVRYLSRIGMEIVMFITLILLYFVNPFDFSCYSALRWMNTVLPVLFIIGMAFSVLRIFSTIWKLFTRL